MSEGDDMNYWEHTDENPAKLPIHEREAWHRDAWDREQFELQRLTYGEAGNDRPLGNDTFGYGAKGTAL